MKEKIKRSLTRREFFAAGGGFAYLLTTKMSSKAGNWGAGLAKRSGMNSDEAKSRVVLVRTEDRETGVKECLKILDIIQAHKRHNVVNREPTIAITGLWPGTIPLELLSVSFDGLTELRVVLYEGLIG